MKLKGRISKINKHLPSKNKKEIDEVQEWLTKNHKEYQQCLKQLFRLRYSAGKTFEQIHQWEEPLKQEGLVAIQRINKFTEYHKGEELPL